METNPQDCAISHERTAPDAAGPSPRDRRMQLRAYNHWASMLGRRRFPAVADLASGILCEIAPHSLLLDVSTDAAGPVIAYLGERLEQECGAGRATLRCLADAPPDSLLGRIGGHYRTVLVNRAPTGFEAEFTSGRGTVVLYRGILLPFSTDDVTIDFVLAVINWKEVTAAHASRDLPVEGAGEASALSGPAPSPATPLTYWADGPGSSPDAPSASVPILHPLSEAVAERLRMLPPLPFSDLPLHGAEFALAMIRRAPGKPVMLLGEVPNHPPLLEQAARLIAR